MIVRRSVYNCRHNFYIPIQPLLLLYGRQHLLAIGALAHTSAAVSLFTYMVHDYGVIPFRYVTHVAGHIACSLILNHQPHLIRFFMVRLHQTSVMSFGPRSRVSSQVVRRIYDSWPSGVEDFG